ncbi:MAG: flavodoxin family protein [Clostridiales bacterium]|nr:flavodoxin family protein [Clostridiales bacterium]
MNVLILNGSPRPNGSTAVLANAFAGEAAARGHQVHLVQIGNKDIRGCKNCDACRSTLNGSCVQKDDMQQILPLMRKCEALVLASPIYYYSMTGQMHCAIERIYSFERLPKLKKAALLLTAGGGGFTAAKQTYQDAIIRHMGAKDLGIVTAVGSQCRTPAKLAEVRELAKKI